MQLNQHVTAEQAVFVLWDAADNENVFEKLVEIYGNGPKQTRGVLLEALTPKRAVQLSLWYLQHQDITAAQAWVDCAKEDPDGSVLNLKEIIKAIKEEEERLRKQKEAEEAERLRKEREQQEKLRLQKQKEAEEAERLRREREQPGKIKIAEAKRSQRNRTTEKRTRTAETATAEKNRARTATRRANAERTGTAAKRAIMVDYKGLCGSFSDYSVNGLRLGMCCNPCNYCMVFLFVQ